MKLTTTIVSTLIILPLLVAMTLLMASPCIADTSDSDKPLALQENLPKEWANGIKFNATYFWLSETEYLPEIDDDISIWHERNFHIKLTKSIGSARFGLGYIDGTIKQDNEAYNDTDFALTRNAPFVLVDWLWNGKLHSRVCLRYEEYSDDGRSGFYQLGDDKTLWTGYAKISYVEQNWWFNISHSRDRDPEPIYDAINDRVELDITAQDLSGVVLGWLLAPQWETAAGVYYEAYGSDRPDQFNYTLQLTHKPVWLPQLQASLGVGYYTEEKDTLINLTLNYRQPLSKSLTLQLEYQLEYSDDEQSLLNQGQVALSYAITKQIGVSVSGEYAKESGDDEDDSLFAIVGVNYRFY